MALSLRVPTIFSARDGVSSVLRTITRNTQAFANKVQSGVGRANKLFNKLTPSIGAAGKQLLSYASAATIAGAAFGLGDFSKQAILDYEDSVASFRTIVSDLNDTDFAKYEKTMGSVATETKKSTIDVAQAYEKIAGLNSTLAETPEGIAEVSKQAIILSKASRDELGPSAENLVGIMNQFNLGAKDSGRVINVLAAGQAVGAASITQSAEAYKNFGSVAKNANITLEESMGLIQTLAGKMITGSEAGTGLKAVILRLQAAGYGYKKGVFNINEALETAKRNYDGLKTSKLKDAYLTDLIGANHINTGAIMLNSIDTYKDFTKGVTGTNEAQNAAAINSNTLKAKIDELKASWVNLITTTDESKEGVNKAKDALGWLATNIESVTKYSLYFIGTLVTVKTTLLVTEGVLALYNIGLGITAALTNSSTIALGTNAFALKAWYITALIGEKTMKLVTAAQWLWNVAMTANPIGLIIVGIAALIAAIVAIVYYWDEWGSTIVKYMGPLGMIIDFCMTLKQNWDMVVSAFKKEGIMGGLKAIGRVLLDVLLKPMQTLLGILGKIPGMSNFAARGIQNIQNIRDGLNVQSSDATERSAQAQKDMDNGKGARVSKPVLGSPLMAGQNAIYESFNTTRNNLDINVNDPNNRVEVVSGKKDNNIKVTKTKGAR